MILPAKIGTVPPAVTALDRYLLAERRRSEMGEIMQAQIGTAAYLALSPRDMLKLRARPRVPGYCADHGWHGGRCAACRLVAK